MKRLATLCAMLVLAVTLTGCDTDVQAEIQKLAAFTQADMLAMLANATKAGDVDGVNCANTLIPLFGQIQEAAPAVKGVLSGVEAAMILNGSAQTPGSVNYIVAKVNTGCAAWFAKLLKDQASIAAKGLALLK